MNEAYLLLRINSAKDTGSFMFLGPEGMLPRSRGLGTGDMWGPGAHTTHLPKASVLPRGYIMGKKAKTSSIFKVR